MQIERVAFTLSNDTVNETVMVCVLRHGYQTEVDIWKAVGTGDFKRLDISSGQQLPDDIDDESIRGIAFELNKEAWSILDGIGPHRGHDHDIKDLWRQILLQFIGSAFTTIPGEVVTRHVLMQMQIAAMDGHFMHVGPTRMEAQPADFFHVPDYIPGGE